MARDRWPTGPRRPRRGGAIRVPSAPPRRLGGVRPRVAQGPTLEEGNLGVEGSARWAARASTAWTRADHGPHPVGSSAPGDGPWGPEMAPSKQAIMEVLGKGASGTHSRNQAGTPVPPCGPAAAALHRPIRPGLPDLRRVVPGTGPAPASPRLGVRSCRWCRGPRGRANGGAPLPCWVRSTSRLDLHRQSAESTRSRRQREDVRKAALRGRAAPPRLEPRGREPRDRRRGQPSAGGGSGLPAPSGSPSSSS